MAPFTMGLPAFMSSMSHSAVIGVGVTAVSVVGVSVYTILRASSTSASPLRGRTHSIVSALPMLLDHASRSASGAR